MDSLNIQDLGSNNLHGFILAPSGKLEVKIELPSSTFTDHIAIICHPNPVAGGTMDHKVVYAIGKALKELGMMVIKFNYRGVGLSEGTLGDTVGEVEDLKAVINWLDTANKAFKVVLAGFSFGAYIASSVVNNQSTTKFVQLITVAPAVTIHDFTTLKHIHCPWLIIQSMDDEIVPAEQVLAMVDKMQNPNCKLIRVLDAGHFFHGRLAELQQLIVANLSL